MELRSSGWWCTRWMLVGFSFCLKSVKIRSNYYKNRDNYKMWGKWWYIIVEDDCCCEKLQAREMWGSMSTIQILQSHSLGPPYLQHMAHIFIFFTLLGFLLGFQFPCMSTITLSCWALCCFLFLFFFEISDGI